MGILVGLIAALLLAVPGAAHAQEIVWLRQLDTPFPDDGRGVATDATGVYVVGFTAGALPGQSSAGSFDAFVRKLDRDGAVLWTRQFGTPAHDEALGVSADSTGIYVVGRTDGALSGQASGGSTDGFVRKYDAAGNELWTRQFGTSGTDWAVGIEAGGSGAYVAGLTDGTLPGQSSAGSYDAFLRKYDADGGEVWTRQFGSSGFDAARGVSADDTAAYVVGEWATVFPVGSSDAFLRKYDAAGTELWSREYGSPNVDVSFDVAVGAGGVFVVGETLGALPGQTSSGDTDGHVRRYSTSGEEVWTRQFGTSSVDSARGVAVDQTGVYVTGYTGGTFPGQESAGFNDAYVAAFAVTGDQLSTRQFGSTLTDLANAVALDETGAYAVGSVAGLTDAFVVKISRALPPEDVVPPVVSVPTAITVDATGPAGAMVDFSDAVSATDDVDGDVGVTCSPASGAVFPIGTTTVSCSATDGAGNSASASFVVTVKGAADQLADLEAAVTGLGPGTSLADKVADASAALAAGKRLKACELLGAIRNEAHAQRGKSVPEQVADELLATTDRIRAVLGC